MNTPSPVRFLAAEELDPIPKQVDQFLQRLGGPAWITLRGADSSRCRVVTTLLHGNEPSGVIAMHRWLKEKHRPQVDLHCFIASVEAALTPPLFSHRSLPDRADLNRCFNPPFDSPEGLLAQSCLQQIRRLQPEAVIDIHNTSGDGPAFAVSAEEQPLYNALATCFTHRMVITDLRFGALLEHTSGELPIVTIEVGGNQEPASHQLAYEGLCNYLLDEDIFAEADSSGLFELLKHPLRLELADHASLTFGAKKIPAFDVTLSDDIEQHNFGLVTGDTVLGWLNRPTLDPLTVTTPSGEEIKDHFFSAADGCLRPLRPLKLFMATPNPEIAASDCICYFVEANRKA